MNPQDVNLTNCDREPIHQLGRIQDFGALIAVNADWFVAHRSTNLKEILGAGRDLDIGARLGRIFVPAALEQLRSSAAAAARNNRRVPLRMRCCIRSSERIDGPAVADAFASNAARCTTRTAEPSSARVRSAAASCSASASDAGKATDSHRWPRAVSTSTRGCAAAASPTRTQVALALGEGRNDETSCHWIS